MSYVYPLFSSLAPRMLAGCLFLLAVCVGAPAQAQDFLEMELADELQTAKDQEDFRTVKTMVITGNRQLGESREDFRAWFFGYQFPVMTRVDADTNLAELRRDLYSDIERAGRSAPDAHDELVNYCFEVSKRIVGENYHPAVRYNFMRLMGDLNAEESESGAPPVPLAAAMPELLKAVSDADQIDAVRVAALIGIQRHVATLLVGSEQDQLNDRREAITSTMLELLDSLQERSSAGGSVEGLAWMKRQAVEILGQLGQVGENGQVYATVMAIMSDPSEPLFLRCAAAEALGQFNFPASFDLAAQEIYTQLGLLAYDCCKQELDRVFFWQEVNMPQNEEYAPRGRGNAPGRGGASPADAEAIYQAGALRQALAMRSIIKEQLGYIRDALENTESLASGADERDLYSEVYKAVAAALKAVDQRDNDDNFLLEDFIDGIEGPTYDLEDLLSATSVEEPADEGDAPGDDPLGLGGEPADDEAPVDPLLEGDPVEEDAGDSTPAEDFVPPGS